MMHKVHAHVTSRLRAVYGDPKTPDLKTFMAEYARALGEFDEETLTRAVSEVIDRHAYPTWPTPGEIKQACLPPPPTYSHTPDTFRDDGPMLPPPTPEQRERARQIVEAAKRAIAAKQLPEATHSGPPDVSRPAFEKMQRSEPRLHMTHHGLTQLSRRMTGEHNE